MRVYILNERKRHKEKLRNKKQKRIRKKKKMVKEEMKINIDKENDNNLMKRKEISIILEHSSEPTPTKAALQQLIAKQTGNSVENIEIKNIFSEFGESKSRASAFIWKDKKVPDLSKEDKKEEQKEEQPAKENSETKKEDEKPEEEKKDSKDEKPKEESKE